MPETLTVMLTRQQIDLLTALISASDMGDGRDFDSGTYGDWGIPADLYFQTYNDLMEATNA